MADHLVDTNVLCAASTADPGSRYGGTDHVPPEALKLALDWLAAFRRDRSRSLVLDRTFFIMREYRNKLTDQDLGLLVVMEKLRTARFHAVEFDQDGHAVLPETLAGVVHDLSDRKFVAVALADGGRSTIVNACDTDWYDWEQALADVGVVVEQLADGWCRGQWERKKKKGGG